MAIFRKTPNDWTVLPQSTWTNIGGDPNIFYLWAYWTLKPDEALVIETTVPECEYWNCQNNNYWDESLDYRYFTIHLNKHTARTAPDGSVRIVVAHRDPGAPNWIDTVGHESGTMCFRWVRAESWPAPQTRVVKHAQVRDLP